MNTTMLIHLADFFLYASSMKYYTAVAKNLDSREDHLGSNFQFTTSCLLGILLNLCALASVQ